jgi:hypothetical protein
MTNDATAAAPARTLRAARAFGVANVTSAALVLFGVFAALPARWWPVDVAAAIVSLLLAIAGAGLLARTSWAERAARAASFVALGLGLALVATVALTASYLNGIYGPVGHGGAIILVLVAALALPYLVVLPAVELAWLGPRVKRETSAP